MGARQQTYDTRGEWLLDGFSLYYSDVFVGCHMEVSLVVNLSWLLGGCHVRIKSYLGPRPRKTLTLFLPAPPR